MPGETLLEYLPQQLALMVVLLIVGLALLALVGLGGIPKRKLKKPFSALFLFSELH